MRRFCYALTALALWSFSPAFAATITVTTNADELNADGDCSLREAVEAANTNAAVDGCAAGEAGADTIVFADDLGGETITLDSAINGSGLRSLEALTIDGAAGDDPDDATDDDDRVTLSGNGDVRVMIARSGMLTLRNLVIRDGMEVRGSGVFVSIDAMFTGDNLLFEGNEATGAAVTDGGGAFYLSAGTTGTLTNSAFTGNAAVAGGAAFNNGGTLTVSGSSFTGNEATGDSTATGGPVGGGAVYNNGGTLALTDVTASGNAASGALGSGGALMSAGGTMTVTGGTIRDNTANRAGAGIESAAATTTLVGVTVRGNDIPAATAMPGNGGGVHAAGDTLTVRGGQFVDNGATEGGGIWSSGVLVVGRSGDDGTLVQNNTGRGADASNGGGGIYVEAGSRATITGATVTGNFASGAAGSGGGVFVNAGRGAGAASTVTISASTIANNRANRAGAGIENAGGTLTLTGVAVSDNAIPTTSAAPGNGGGLHSGGGTVTVNGGTFSGNQATEGGGLWTNGTLVVGVDTLGTGDARFARITGNVGRGADASNGGGGVYAETGATVTLTRAVITGNAATGAAGSGGGILVADSSSVTVVGGTVSGNRANRAGAGIEVADNPETGDDGDDATEDGADTVLSLTQVTVDGNAIATANPGNGGGLHIGGAGEVTVTQSTFSNNTAREGAGLWAAAPSTLVVQNSTVSGNTAAQSGGGIYDDGGAAITVESSTVALNAAGTDGGGLVSQSATGFTVANTVLAYNTAGGTGPSCSGTFVSGDYNLVQTPADCTFTGEVGNNIVGQDPMLAPLADNGGPTRTHLPMGGSPVLDAGSSAFRFDQRGLNRTDEQDDIGAVEADASPVAGTNGPEGAELALMPTRPNPMRDGARVAFTVAEAAQARVELYNMLGQRVQVLFEGTVAAGAEQTVDIDASRLAAGVYLVRLESRGEQVMQRVTVVR